MDLYNEGRNMVMRDSYVTSTISSSLQQLASEQETFTYSTNRDQFHYIFDNSIMVINIMLTKLA